MKKLNKLFVSILPLMAIIAIMTFVSTNNCGVVFNSPNDIVYANNNKPKLAIVIDDFGEDRRGVEEMLAIDCKLTCAVMPGMEYSVQDAEKIHACNKEVILHMPMEAYGNLPSSWYGPVCIRNYHSPMEARNILTTAIQSLPYVNGVNIHMGTAVSQNETLMREILSVTKERNLVFLDSKTIEGSVCPMVAKELSAPFLDRDIFLEVNSSPNYGFALGRIAEAVECAKNNGQAVAIGHIGPVGRVETARAIKDSLDFIASEGVELVFLSELDF